MVTRNGGDVDVLEEAARPDLPVGDRVLEHPAGEAEVSGPGDLSQTVEQVEEDLLGPGLDPGRDVEVLPTERLPGLALRKSEFPGEEGMYPGMKIIAVRFVR